MTDYIAKTLDFPMPLLKVQENSFFLKTTGESFTGGFNPAPRAAGARYKIWSCSISVNALHDTDQKDLRFEWEAFIHSLDGVRIGFRIPDTLRLLPKGAGAGLSRSLVGSEIYRVDGGVDYSLTDTTKLISGYGPAKIVEKANRYADTILVGGLTPNAAVFRPGDLIGIGGNMHEIQQVAVSDSSGQSRVTLNNRLWKDALADDIATVENVTGRFVLADKDQGRAIRNLVTSAVSAEMIEVPYLE